jgi:hypothetical protein
VRVHPARTWSTWSRALAFVAGLGACAREPVEEQAPAIQARAEADATAEESAAAVVDERPAWPLPDEILTPWQFALIVMDPHHLTAEQRRQRAYARRKAMALNPDSVTARVLDDLAKAAEAGEIDPNASSQIVFTARGAEGGTKGPPPAGWRPAAGADASADTPAPSADGSP